MRSKVAPSSPITKTRFGLSPRTMQSSPPAPSRRLPRPPTGSDSAAPYDRRGALRVRPPGRAFLSHGGPLGSPASHFAPRPGGRATRSEATSAVDAARRRGGGGGPVGLGGGGG